MANPHPVKRGPARDKPFRDALRIVSKELEAGEVHDYPRGCLRWNAQQLLLRGEVPAIKEAADRLDGKVPQAIVGDDEHDPLRVDVTDQARARALASLIARTKK